MVIIIATLFVVNIIFFTLTRQDIFIHIFFLFFQNLDLFTNPVVFVTCSLIFVVYVVSVIICRRLDQSNLERISSIPLCGKDGSFKYEVTVITGRQPGAGK